MNSKLEINRCLIPTLVTDDRRTKPYHNQQIRYEKDNDEEKEDIWDEETNPSKRGRNQEVRSKKPVKRQKPNSEEDEKEQEKPEYRIIETKKRTPNTMQEKPNKTMRKVEPYLPEYKPSLPGTLPEISLSFPTNSQQTDQIDNLTQEKFLKLFSREDASISRKSNPKSKLKRCMTKGAIKYHNI